MATTPGADFPRDSLMINLIATAGGAALMGAIGLGLSHLFGLTGEQEVVAASVSLLLGLLLTRFFLRRVPSFLDRFGLRYMSRHTGIVLTYRNLDECKDDMQADFRREKRISLLLQIGRQELGDSKSSYFYSLAKEKDLDSQIRILRASVESPFLSEARAKRRGNDPKRWKEDMRRLGAEIALLQGEGNSKAKIEERQHLEPYLWRIFIFGDIAYVSAYLHQRENDKKAIVYKLKDGEGSLYPVFKKYFDYLWIKYDPRPTDPNERWAEWK